MHDASGLGATVGLIAEIADKLVGTGAVNMVVVDSVAALVPKAEIEAEISDAHLGLRGRLISLILRKLTAATAPPATALAWPSSTR